MGRQGVDISEDQRRRFLSVLKQCGVTKYAAQAAGASRQAFYTIREKDPEFAKQWAEAEAEGVDVLEHHAIQRATEGWPEPVFYEGVHVGDRQRFSDRLLEFLLKGKRREVFGDHQDVNHNLNQAAEVVIVAPDNGRGPKSKSGNGELATAANENSNDKPDEGENEDEPKGET